MKKIPTFLLIMCFALGAYAQHQEEKIQIEQYLIASQLYLKQGNAFEFYAKNSAEIALERAIKLNDNLWIARSYTTLGLYGLRYGEKIQFSSDKFRQAQSIYEELLKKQPNLAQEVKLVKAMYQKIYDTIPSYNESNSIINFSQPENGELSLFANFLRIDILSTTNINPLICSQVAIEKYSKDQIDSVRLIGFKALSHPTTATHAIIRKIASWYYRNEIKSPELHAFEAWYDDYPMERTYYNIQTSDISNTKLSVALCSDVEGNFLWTIPSNYVKKATQLPKFQLGTKEMTKLIYQGLIHPKVVKDNWTIIHMADKIAYLGFYDANSKFVAHSYAYTSKKDDLKTLSAVNSITPNIMFSGSIISAIATLYDPKNVDNAIVVLTMKEIDIFKSKLETHYKNIDTNWVENNLRLGNRSKKILVEDVKNLKKYYSNMKIFQEDFIKFSDMIHKINRDGGDLRIHLNRRGYLGAYLGGVFKKDSNTSSFTTFFNNLWDWWLVFLDDTKI
jgi:hypothetical protein